MGELEEPPCPALARWYEERFPHQRFRRFGSHSGRVMTELRKCLETYIVLPCALARMAENKQSLGALNF